MQVPESREITENYINIPAFLSPVVFKHNLRKGLLSLSSRLVLISVCSCRFCEAVISWAWRRVKQCEHGEAVEAPWREMLC